MSSSQSAFSTLPYRLGVGIMLLNPDGEVFVGQRIDTRSEAWQMPQGGIDEGEQPQIAAMRELLEETGISNVSIIHESHDWLTYDLPDRLIPQLWGGQFRGQKQKWFLMRYLGKDSDINIHTEEPEFSVWKWIAPSDLPALIVPFKQQLYKDIVETFKEFL